MNAQINVNVHGEIRFPDLMTLAQAITGKTASAPTVSVVPGVTAVPGPDPAAVTTVPPVAPAPALFRLRSRLRLLRPPWPLLRAPQSLPAPPSTALTRSPTLGRCLPSRARISWPR